MKIHAILLLTAALGFSSPLKANDISFNELVGQSGLSKQQVRMLIGARTPYGAYRTSFERSRRQLIAAVGQARYQQLVKAAELERLGHFRSTAG